MLSELAYRFALGGSVDELLAEVLPVLVGGRLLNDNLLVVVRQLEDDVLVLLRQLQVVVGSYALLRNGGSGYRLALAPGRPCATAAQARRAPALPASSPRWERGSGGRGSDEVGKSARLSRGGYEPGLRLHRRVSDRH